MNIEPLIELAHAIHTRPGVYALLLGSGISRSAGIPTGYEVTLELIRRLAALEGVAELSDPTAWFQERYREAPSYSAILERLAPLPAERQSQLRPFFEPSEAERAEGRKLPTAAHRAIARLVARGSVRVMVTTNFDRLLEQALHDEGVAAVVIHNVDSAAGAPPLVHNRCTVVKVHGDYLDTRIKNTTAELATYDPALDSLLDRIFDEYGLLVCGWSSEWDEALRRAVERSPRRRYSTYWASRGDASGNARSLIDHRGATVVRIEDADQFFDQLQAKIAVLDEMDRPHPLSIPLAVAELKRYLTRPEDRIRLSDLITDATEAAEAACTPIHSSPNSPVSGVALVERLGRYEAAVDPLLNLLATGVYFGNSENAKLWVHTLDRLCSLPQAVGFTAWISARRYPALLALYTCGLAASASGDYKTLEIVLSQTKVRDQSINRVSGLLDAIVPHRVVRDDMAQQMPGYQGDYTALSNRINHQLAPLFQRIAQGDEFQELFDRWEYLYCLVLAVGRILQHDQQPWIPIGRFGWRNRGENVSAIRIRREIETLGDAWPPYRAGLFEGTVATLLNALDLVDAQVAQRQWFR